MGFNPKQPKKYYAKVSSKGYDMVILIKNEQYLNVYRNNRYLWKRNEFYEHDEMQVVFDGFDPKKLPFFKN